MTANGLTGQPPLLALFTGKGDGGSAQPAPADGMADADVGSITAPVELDFEQALKAQVDVPLRRASLPLSELPVLRPGGPVGGGGELEGSTKSIQMAPDPLPDIRVHRGPQTVLQTAAAKIPQANGNAWVRIGELLEPTTDPGTNPGPTGDDSVADDWAAPAQLPLLPAQTQTPTMDTTAPQLRRYEATHPAETTSALPATVRLLGADRQSEPSMSQAQTRAPENPARNSNGTPTPLVEHVGRQDRPAAGMAQPDPLTEFAPTRPTATLGAATGAADEKGPILRSPGAEPKIAPNGPVRPPLANETVTPTGGPELAQTLASPRETTTAPVERPGPSYPTLPVDAPIKQIVPNAAQHPPVEHPQLFGPTRDAFLGPGGRLVGLGRIALRELGPAAPAPSATFADNAVRLVPGPPRTTREPSEPAVERGVNRSGIGPPPGLPAPPPIAFGPVAANPASAISENATMTGADILIDVPEVSSAGETRPTDRPVGEPAPARFAEIFHRPAVVRGVLVQLSQAASLNLAERPVELSLDPAELGRVRLTLSSTDGTMTLSVTAERPETLDMMRRNSDALAAEYRALGYAGVNISFGGPGDWQAREDGSQGDGRQSGRDGSDPAPQAANTQPGMMASRPVNLGDERLDIRI